MSIEIRFCQRSMRYVKILFSIFKYKQFSKLVGDFNALCTKDSDCQRYMICSGMNDGTRRCQCQNQYHYDDERRRCRKLC